MTAPLLSSDLAATKMSLALPRARSLTDALVAPGTVSVPAEDLGLLRARLARELPPIVGELPPGERLQLDAYRFALACERPESCAAADTAFVVTPATCRRAVGLSAVERCVRGRSAAPASAVREVLAAAVEDVEHATDASVQGPWVGAPWWARWYAGLSAGARAVVEAEAVTWATQLWTALAWERLARPPVIGGRDDFWQCPGTTRLTLRARADVRVWEAEHPALLVMGSGVPAADWRLALGYRALVVALARGERALPVRVVGLWPASGQTRILGIDRGVLTEIAAAVVGAVATWVDVRLGRSARDAHRTCDVRGSA